MQTMQTINPSLVPALVVMCVGALMVRAAAGEKQSHCPGMRLFQLDLCEPRIIAGPVKQ